MAAPSTSSVSDDCNNDVIAYRFNSPKFVAGYKSTFYIDDNGNLFSFGSNCFGMLGQKDVYKLLIPNIVSNLVNINIVSNGIKHTVCADYDGNLFSMGSNDSNQLGIGVDYKSCDSTSVPQKLECPPISYITCGEYFTICLSFDSLVYSFGKNSSGQLGLGDTKMYYSPTLVNNLYDVDIIEAGGDHVICCTVSEEYYSWGNNSHGQLGIGYEYISDIFLEPIQCKNWPKAVVSIKCGYAHSLLLTAYGYVYSFGYNYCGQLGLNMNESVNFPELIPSLPLITKIGVGSSHSICLDVDSNMWVFGYNANRQLGLEKTENRYKPICNDSIKEIVDISVGGYHTFVKTLNDGIYAFGRNNECQFGIESFQSIPIKVFQNTENIWISTYGKSKQKSARK